ncbi:unnamed protein product [Phyllotreta striolata]|uniref:Uncharacterized protein n=1 Tax=Phyllotreta striolata TaxID=444603 RepID=A0A9N9TKP7_PHYSR|nr:unnamed protein product [Phyllotreta striolata]
MKSELSPEAPVYVPPPLRNAPSKSPRPPSNRSTPSPAQKEPQCSRYSRKSVRTSGGSPNSPRPILGGPFPRAILGRGEFWEAGDGGDFDGSFRRLKDDEDDADDAAESGADAATGGGQMKKEEFDS